MEGSTALGKLGVAVVDGRQPLDAAGLDRLEQQGTGLTVPD